MRQMSEIFLRCVSGARPGRAISARHARMLGVCAASLATLAVLASAPAAGAEPCHVYGTTCETERQHAEFLAFANCPFGASKELDCSWALTGYKEMWPSAKIKAEWEADHERAAPGLLSEIKAGNVIVPLKQGILLRGGIGLESEGEAETWFGAEGAETIQAVPEPAAPLTKDVDTALLSESELDRYEYYVKVSKETKVTATVELAGPASSIQVSATNLIYESGTAFAFPVKLKLSNPFVGNDCYVGSNGSPILVEFTTGTSGSLKGKAGSRLSGGKNGFIVTILTDTLVNNTFASPGVEGCGVAGGADAAINAALGLPSPSGQNISILNGTLKLATAENAKEGLEGKI